MVRNLGRQLPFTDIRDPKIDEKPPPYECSTCGYSTWSWNEAKNHICRTAQQTASKGASDQHQKLTYAPQPLPERTLEELIRITLKAREQHPDWTMEQLTQYVSRSLDRKKVTG